MHNIYLQYAAERGIPTLLFLLWMLGKILWDFWSALRRLPAGLDHRRFLLHGAVATTLGVLVTGFVEYNLGDSEILSDVPGGGVARLHGTEAVADA